MAEKPPWEILGVSEDCDYLTLKRAFRRCALACHPDKLQQASVESRYKNEPNNAFGKELLEKIPYNTESTESASFQIFLKAFEAMKSGLLSNNETRLMENCRQLPNRGEGNVNRVPLSQLEKLDDTLFCKTCRCGSEIPIEKDFWWDFEDFLTVDCEGCSALYRIDLKE